MLNSDGAVRVVDGHKDVVMGGLPENAEPGGHQREAPLLPPVGLQTQHNPVATLIPFLLSLCSYWVLLLLLLLYRVQLQHYEDS